ncbi:ABC transporter ATP-binding protein [Halomicroarcula sp. GCM10025324]|uniref:ABC transporter ATP-binding protein n=1 Tax=Haloarcula TaxID=2237 RepID=UPI0023E8F66E|nr:oligopeptide/dipeptide ABC transporter ATP-binding protein [Halomicroarcula sp. ZS-22-S1]
MAQSTDTSTVSDVGASLSSETENEIIMQCTGVKKYYPVTGGVLQRKISEVKAVDNVDIRIRRGEIQGVVGESGCGKSTLARVLVNLNAPTGGNIYFDVPEETADEISDLESTPEGERSQEEKNRLKELRKEYEINTISGKRAKHYRQNTQFVFQNPNSSLNPRKLIRQTVEQPLKVHTDMSAEEREDRIADLLEKVGLGADFLYRYPHQLSGGQKQRVAIARAIATNPDFVVLDEPTSALDVSVQAQILNLLQDLQADLGLTYLFITHDLGVIRHMATDIAVMYLGKIVENASRAELFSDPQHPYTEALISSSPAIEMDREERIRLRGDVPDPQDRPRGCFFHTRCHKAESFCGWSGTDVLSIVQANVTKDPFVEELNDTLEDTEFDGYEASFTFDGSTDIDDARRALAGEDDTLRSFNEIPFEAITDVSVDGRTVTLSFRESETPELIEDQPGRTVACHLYDEEYAAELE